MLIFFQPGFHSSLLFFLPSPLVLSVSLIQLQADQCHLSSSFTSLTQSFNLLLLPLFPSFTPLPPPPLPAFFLLSPHRLSSLSFSVSLAAVIAFSRPLVIHYLSLPRFYPLPSRPNTLMSVWLVRSLCHNCIPCRSLSAPPLHLSNSCWHPSPYLSLTKHLQFFIQ